eukprot:scaffold99782_cov16-Tisochrysis_lutea.AAC.1
MAFSPLGREESDFTNHTSYNIEKRNARWRGQVKSSGWILNKALERQNKGTAPSCSSPWKPSATKDKGPWLG